MKNRRQHQIDRRGSLEQRLPSVLRVILAVLFLCNASVLANAQTPAAQSALIRDVRFDQKLNQQLPLDLTFKDERGDQIRLGDYFGNKPVILSLVYYKCPMLCTLVLNGLTEVLIEQKFNVGQEFNVVTVSFDPNETPALAEAKKSTYLARYGRPGASDGWHFLTGDQANIDRLTEAVGFHYHFDPATGQFAHPSGIMVLTPQGKIARYFYGIEYPARDLRLGLIEASQERIGSPVDQVLLLCYHYDPKSGKYNSIAMGSMRVGGVLTLIGLSLLVLVLWRAGKRKALATLSCETPITLILRVLSRDRRNDFGEEELVAKSVEQPAITGGRILSPAKAGLVSSIDSDPRVPLASPWAKFCRQLRWLVAWSQSTESRTHAKRKCERARGTHGSMLLSLTAFSLFLIPLFPTAASTDAQSVDDLFIFMLALCGFVALTISLLVIYFAIRYRRRSEDQLALWAGSVPWLEWAWTIVPLVIFIGIFFWGVKLYFAAVRPPSDAIEIHVVAKQWMWKFQHPEGQREINELHVPVGRRVKLTMISQDVIHSLFVPDFRLHRDVLPGRYLESWFEATKPGRYHLFCSQYCGTNHSAMVGYVYVMEPADYQRWLTGGGEGSLASQGQKLFRQLACNTCHTGDSLARGPVLDGLFGTTVRLQDGSSVLADENYLRESILKPREKVVAGFQPIMPTFQNQVDEEQVLELIDYLKSLGTERQQVPPVSAPQGPQPSPVQGAIKSSESKRP